MGCSTSSSVHPASTNGHAQSLPRQVGVVSSIGVIGTAAAAVPNIQRVLEQPGQGAFQPQDLFCDAQFPAQLSSLNLAETPPEELEWKRPQEMCENPSLFVDGSARCDVKQGSLGDCWLLASISALAQYPSLMNKVLDKRQVLIGPGYDGCLRVRLWKFGRWRSILIDDRLPVVEGRLFFANSAFPNEYWAPLLEKAVAKFHSNYGALDGGLCLEGLTCLTGGLAEPVVFQQTDPEGIFPKVRSGLQSKAVITCAKWNEMEGGGESTGDDGLVSGHAYSITGASEVILADQSTVMLVRIRNPWGDDTEWKGAWSDGDSSWEQVNQEVRERLEAEKVRANGEFWMSVEDFRSEFSMMTICNLMPDLDGDGDGDQGVSGQMEGLWEEGMEKQYQYLLRLRPLEDDDDEGTLCWVVLALMQEPVRGTDRENKAIGFSIYEAEEDTCKPLDNLEDQDHQSTEPETISEVVYRFEMAPGNYVVVPFASDLQPEEKRHFLLRAYAASGLNLLPLLYH